MLLICDDWKFTFKPRLPCFLLFHKVFGMSFAILGQFARKGNRILFQITICR
jgi:hypothetical protein